MKAYYNEFDPRVAAMLRELIANRVIADGDVDERSILEVTPDDIKGYSQCHFFAGIGGWSVALKLANWPDDRPVWTGSCPCQPFSMAGKQKGKNDERHLWPYWFKLIKTCKPTIIFGEQVSAAITHGWWDDVANDLETEGYEVGAAVLPACSVGRPHKRDRLWFVGDSQYNGSSAETIAIESSRTSTSGNVPIDVANSFSQGQCYNQKAYATRISESLQFIDCPDGKKRIVKSGIRLLANGVPYRTPTLHALGNAIVPQVAAKFIEAYLNKKPPKTITN